jgi:hypothetical protein
MTPKEKAEELVDKYATYVVMWKGDINSTHQNCKQCALIAVDELIYFSSNQSLSVDFDSNYYCDYDFFIEVKKEIEAL